MCDITNPLYGEHGAAYVFAPQKGANKNLVKKLDKNLILLSNIIKEKLNIDVSSVEGSGAAGGMGAGIIAFFGGKLTSGINTILDLFDFDSKIKDADFIFTGEGKLIANHLMVRLYQVLQHVLNAKMFLLLPYVEQLVMFLIRYTIWVSQLL